MKSEIISYITDNQRELPISFYTISRRYTQSSVSRPRGQKNFHQILFVLEGTGELRCGGESFELKEGCAFFTNKEIPVEYINNGGLVSAFLTANGDAIEALCRYYEYGDFFFCKKVNTEKYIALIDSIIHEYYEYKRESVLSSMVYSFFVDFFEEKRPLSQDISDKISLYLEKNFTEKISLSHLANLYGISISKLCHDFKRKFGHTVFEHILNLRLTYARNYFLSNTKVTTKEVAILCGFEDVSYFCRAYKKKFGVSPRNSI